MYWWFWVFDFGWYISVSGGLESARNSSLKQALCSYDVMDNFVAAAAAAAPVTAAQGVFAGRAVVQVPATLILVLGEWSSQCAHDGNEDNAPSKWRVLATRSAPACGRHCRFWSPGRPGQRHDSHCKRRTIAGSAGSAGLRAVPSQLRSRQQR